MWSRSDVVGAFAAFASALVLLSAPCAAAEGTPALWTGPHDLAMHAGTLRQFPGERTLGETLFEMDLAYVRTGRLSADFVAGPNGQVRLPAGTPLFATRLIRIRSNSPLAVREPEPAPDTHHWCAIPEPDEFVCFFWSSSGQVFYNTRSVGGPTPDRRAPFGAFEPSPMPLIAEQAVEIGPRRRLQVALADVNDEGYRLSVTHRRGDRQDVFYTQRTSWGEDHRPGYSSGIVMRLAPVRGSDGLIRAARVDFLSASTAVS